MKVIKLVGVIVGLLVLAILVPFALGLLGRSLVGLIALFALLLLLGALTWGRRMDAIGGKSWFVRQVDRGATQAHDRLLQDDDTMRERSARRHLQRHHDLE